MRVGEHNAADPLIGSVLDGRYRIDAVIGMGGMGAVYRGTHLMLNQRIALKVMRPHLAADPAAVRRFSREARGSFALDSEHCVRVTDFGATDDGLVYLVMELLDGRTVGDELAIDGPMSPPRVVHIATQICAALDAAHRLGFVHRDLFARNLLVETGPAGHSIVFLDAWRGGPGRGLRGPIHDLACLMLDGARLFSAGEQRLLLRTYRTACPRPPGPDFLPSIARARARLVPRERGRHPEIAPDWNFLDAE